MKDDVKRLARRAGWSGDEYREIAAQQQEDEAARTWPLIAAVNRCLAAPMPTETAPAVSPAAAPRELSTRTIVQWRA